MSVDLSDLSLEDLKSLRKKIDRLIDGWEERRRREALAAAEEAARSHGFNLSDLGVSGGKRRGGAKPASVARYANPANAAETWSGRGRRPEWLKAALDAGRSLEDLAI